MSKVFGMVLSYLGSAAASVGSAGCFLLLYDEPKMPKSLIK